MRGQYLGKSHCSQASISSATGKMRPEPSVGTPFVRLAFMCRVARRNLGFLLSGEVINVVERHRRDMPIGGLLKQEAANSLAHAEQRRERHPHRPLVDVRAREALSENVGRRLLIEP